MIKIPSRIWQAISLLSTFALFTVLILYRHHIASQVKSWTARFHQQACSLLPIDVQFSNNVAYQNLSHEHDPLWRDLVTPNGGFFFETAADGEIEAYGISMFHQLHCLAMIRTSVQEVRGRSASTGTIKDRYGDGGMDVAHLLHCLDYIRQVGLGRTFPTHLNLVGDPLSGG
jgi:Mycotoxin biosynthesis protein UstYa